MIPDENKKRADEMCLPESCAKYDAVLYLAERDYSFRCDVLSNWDNPAWRAKFIRDAEKRTTRTDPETGEQESILE